MNCQTETRGLKACIYPLTFAPAFRDYMWGGRRLETLYGRVLPPGIVAESWEISGHPHGPTVADDGCWAGCTLPEILDRLGDDLVGTHAGWALERGRFPLLVKLLDANRDLSVQVHPDDAYALEYENGEYGKTEMWYVLHADPGAGLILGLRPGTTREMFRAALEGGDVASLLRRVSIRAGQAIFLPAGTLHALLAGAVVAEIQQNSDTTYRIYDWGRVGPDGRPRPVHIEKGLAVTHFDARPDIVVPRRVVGETDGAVRLELARSRYFVIEEVTFGANAAFRGRCDGSTMEIWGCVSGRTAVESVAATVPLPEIRFALLPAALGEFRVVAGQASTCLRVYLPDG